LMVVRHLENEQIFKNITTHSDLILDQRDKILKLFKGNCLSF
jgi:hypothetical protein